MNDGALGARETRDTNWPPPNKPTTRHPRPKWSRNTIEKELHCFFALAHSHPAADQFAGAFSPTWSARQDRKCRHNSTKEEATSGGYLALKSFTSLTSSHSNCNRCAICIALLTQQQLRNLDALVLSSLSSAKLLHRSRQPTKTCRRHKRDQVCNSERIWCHCQYVAE